jgi:hypothetical protein
LNERKARETDLDRLSRLKALSWLSPSELKLLASALLFSNYKRHALILRDVAVAQGAHILLSGIARITCRNPGNERVTVALLAPDRFPISQRWRSVNPVFNARLITIAALEL